MKLSRRLHVQVRSFGICRVVESRNPALAEGALVGGGFSVFPWRLYQTFGASELPAPLDNPAGISETWASRPCFRSASSTRNQRARTASPTLEAGPRS